MVAQTSGASLTVTASPYRTVLAAANLSVTASPQSRPYSIPLRYLGTGPSSQTNNPATKKYADTYFQANSLVDQLWIEDQCDTVRGNLLLQDDVQDILNSTDGSGNRLYPTISQFNTEKNKYPNTTSLGAASGLAVATSTGALNPIYIPNNIKVDNKATYYNCLTAPTSSVFFSGTMTYVATSSLIIEYEAASITISDPGFSYYPMSFVYIQGKSSGSTDSRSVGTQNTGLITVAPAPTSSGQLPSTLFAQGTCSPNPYKNWHMALPYVSRWDQGAPTKLRAGTTAFRGDMTLNLYLSNYAGTNYTFYAEGMTWYVILFPTNTSTVAA
jgi:hypothetical protein